MIPPPHGCRLPPDRRSPRRVMPFLAMLACGFMAAAGTAGAQNIGTARDNEFRSRWANYQVDRPQQTDNSDSDATDSDAAKAEETGLLAAFGKSFDDLFRNGPLQVRANIASGWEFSDEDNLRVLNPNGTDNSFFAAPALGLFYNQELGPLTVSARYSAGYVYYFDQNYLAANHDGGILSQTAGLDLGFDAKRLSVTSRTAASYGNGNDIESGQLRNLLDASEILGATYPLTEFTQLGSTASIDYQRYSGGMTPVTRTISDSGSIYGDYVITGKTRLRLEGDVGQQLQETGGSPVTSDQYYFQGILSANYVPAPKLTFDAGLGYDFTFDSEVAGSRHSTTHPVYRITIQYTPTPKTTASVRFGYEGVDVDPDFQLSVQWQFRLNTSAALSVYENSNFSDYEIGQSLVTRGALAAIQQHLFARMDVSLSGGVEQSTGYSDINTGTNPNFSEKPYYFAGVSVIFNINSYLAIQGYYRGYTGEAGEITTEKGLQSRAAVSLRLTF